jgi:hypothetical protein
MQASVWPYNADGLLAACNANLQIDARRSTRLNRDQDRQQVLEKQ